MQRAVRPSYAYDGVPGIMSDRTASMVPEASAARDSKRRRIDGAADHHEGVAAAAAAAAATTATGQTTTHGAPEAFPQWHERFPARAPSASASASQPSAPGQPAGTASTEYTSHQAAHPAQGLTEGTPWQHADPAAYPPEGAHYSPQPYFYQQHQNPPAAHAASWPTTSDDSSSYAGIPTAPPSTVPVGEPAANLAMPYFPASTSVSTNDLPTDTIEGASSLGYTEVENTTQYATYGVNGAGTVQRPSRSFYFDDAGMHLKIQSLPILDNLATQLIQTIARASYPQIQDMMRSDGSEDGQAYRTLKNLFDQTRKVYSRETPFIDAIAIQMFQPTQQEIIRKANIATFISSILGAHDVSFFHLNEFFMETFVPLGHRLLKWQGAIYLELKTQTYISALINSDGSPEEMLEELFPPDLDAQILTRHPDAPSLSPSEQDFIDRSRSRKSYLLAEPRTEDNLRELPKKYQWTDFVREFASCITKNVDGIMNVPARSQVTASAKGANVTTETTGQAGNAGHASSSASQAANGKSGEGKKSAAAASTIRQPWTKPEEDALLSGLERVNGPHWSQILALYGRGGSVSEVLKDRNQVQLKDKARNLKLWYLKTGKEVPVALRGVTGELRKRGGARARAALGIMDEDQAAGADDDADMNDGEENGNRADRASKKKAKK